MIKKAAKISSTLLQPIETIILNLGVDVLRGIKNLTAVNPDASIKKIKDALSQTIEKVKQSNDIAGLELINAQLQRLNSIGGINSILPTEGIVFTYNNKLYKLTGAFAPINRIIGYLKFKK